MSIKLDVLIWVQYRTHMSTPSGRSGTTIKYTVLDTIYFSVLSWASVDHLTFQRLAPTITISIVAPNIFMNVFNLETVHRSNKKYAAGE